MRNILSKVIAKLVDKVRRSFIIDDENRASSVFDYQYNCRERRSRVIEKYDSNIMYGIGDVFRKYAEFRGQIYCCTEHGIPTLRLDNYSEFRDNDAPILLAHSFARRQLIQSMTNKIIIPCGPSFIPYAKGIYTKFQIEQIKKNNGKTLVVFPLHNNDVSAYVNYKKEQEDFIKYINELKCKGSFEKVLVCLYYVDVEQGRQFVYEQQGWQVVSAGNNKNFDFADLLKSIYEIADAAIVQGYSGVAYSTYMRKPCQYYVYDEEMVIEREERYVIKQIDWLQPTKEELVNLFSGEPRYITDEQWLYCKETWGYDCVKSPQELNLIFQYATDIHKKNIMKSNVLLRIAKKKKYKPIYDMIAEAINYRDMNYKG